MMNEKLLNGLIEVVSQINHEIDSNHQFLHMIYSRESNENTSKYISYSSADAMNKYSERRRQKFTAVIKLCNGAAVGKYGDRTECKLLIAEAEADYKRMNES